MLHYITYVNIKVPSMLQIYILHYLMDIILPFEMTVSFAENALGKIKTLQKNMSSLNFTFVAVLYVFVIQLFYWIII